MPRFCLILLFSVAVVSAAAAKPNIVIFLVDDLGWRDLGCQGSEYYRTPRIDGLAEEGMRFTDAYAACAVCSPTRASLLTGKYPARLLLTQWLPAGRWDPTKHRMQEGRFLRALPLEEVTLAEALRDAGYATVHIGKWHLGSAPFSLPEQHGFDVNVGGSEHGAPGAYFHPYTGRWTIPTTGTPVVKRTLPDGEPGEYLPDRLTDEAIARIEEFRDRPFFLYLPFYAVHTPLQAREERVARYEAVPKAERQGKPTYAAMVESVDENVGRVLDRLDELELSEDTYIVFTSDNGGYARATDNAPLRANKGSHYEGGIRVPLIVRGPGIREGSVTDLPVTSADLYPTVLEWLGVPAPDAQRVDGVSLARLVRRGERPDREAIFWHYPHYNRHPENAPVSIIRKGKWKLIEFLETGDRELYDLSADLSESNDLAGVNPETARALHDELREWRAEVGAEPMRPNPIERSWKSER